MHIRAGIPCEFQSSVKGSPKAITPIVPMALLIAACVSNRSESLTASY